MEPCHCRRHASELMEPWVDDAVPVYELWVAPADHVGIVVVEEFFRGLVTLAGGTSEDMTQWEIALDVDETLERARLRDGKVLSLNSRGLMFSGHDLDGDEVCWCLRPHGLQVIAIHPHARATGVFGP